MRYNAAKVFCLVVLLSALALDVGAKKESEYCAEARRQCEKKCEDMEMVRWTVYELLQVLEINH